MITAPPTLQDYLNLVTSQHRDKPKFMAKVAEEIQPLVDIMATLFSMIGRFTPNATGNDLDMVGTRVGTSRNLEAALTGVYFTWGNGGPGWGAGTMISPTDSPSGLTVLPDDAFQTLIKLTIAQNNWDGTIPGAYAVWNAVMGSGFPILIQDNQDMTMLVVFPAGIQSVVVKALLADGYFNMRPAGVRVSGFAQPSIPNNPIFGFGTSTPYIAGWGTGCFIEPIQL
ncbi:DUF2612 domain-containing protein [Acidobacteria bacterium AB60]|nr:DUF2612 domain-containing protein [Acidobacteria bacterium AB60]